VVLLDSEDDEGGGEGGPRDDGDTNTRFDPVVEEVDVDGITEGGEGKLFG